SSSRTIISQSPTPHNAFSPPDSERQSPRRDPELTRARTLMSASTPASEHGLQSMSPRSRLSRVSSTSGSFSQKSLQNFRTVSLPGLFPSTHLGILASGFLDKRRDGAVRGGWAKRLFILSTRSFHYYRKTEENELFGKERGQAGLHDIALAKYVPPEDAPYGAVEPGVPSYFFAIVSRKSLLMFLRAESMEIAQGWVTAINRAVHIAKSLNYPPAWPVEQLQGYIAAASSNFDEEPQQAPAEAPVAKSNASIPKVLVVSMATTTDYSPQTSQERLIKRHVELRKELELGTFGKKDFCIIALSDGEEVHIPQHMLGTDLSALLSSEKELVLSTPPRSKEIQPNIVTVSKIYVTVRCTRAPPVVLLPQASGQVRSSSQPRPSAMSTLFPGALGGLFLLSCMVSIYCAAPFEGLMKITIVLGCVLSVSQIAQFVFCAYSSQAAKRLPGPDSNPPKGGSQRGHDLIFFMRIDKIEVIESDQDVAPLPLDNFGSPTSTQMTGQSPSSVDGSASAISGGPLPFSQRFIAAEKGDEEKGRQRFANTLEWRKENDIDHILVKPHPKFDTIKKYYPQYFHGRAKKGNPVYYERAGKIDLAGLKAEGLSIEDLLQHYMYITEYLWRVIEPNDSARSVTVLDVSGIGMSDLGGEVMDFIKRASAFTGAHYPERSAHIFIINIPGWFSMVWRLVKPLIDPVTREKIHMLKGSSILRELEEIIDSDQIPSDFGGRGCPLGEAQEEQDLHPVAFEDVSCATYRIRDGIQQTSCKLSPLLSRAMGYEIYLKKDYRQMTGSFKERGARNTLLQLTPEQKQNGVVAASAGNHALALAYHGKALGIPVTCVMPNIAPLTKISSCQDLGARVILHGSHILEAREKADEFARDENLVYINGFDHPDIIAGAGTMGIEILNQVPNVDAIIVPVGGGGLIAGIALAVKTLAPNVQVIGVEPELCPSFSGALEAGHPIHVPTSPTLADGLAVPCVGSNAFQVAKDRVDRVVTVSERAIALSVLRLVEQEKVVVEGGGAASLAALIDDKLPDLKGKRIVLPLCGGNIDIPVLGRVIERGLAADGRLVRFVATVSDRPGGIAQLANMLWECGVSVKDIYHERAWVHASVSHVAVKCVVETSSYEHGLELKKRLEEAGYPLLWGASSATNL
ncbi:TPA: hypothetical protein N0F65_008316, partial [Lagenidium giganteum]